LGCNAATVSKVRGRWVGDGEAGLIDRREDNGQTKADDRFARILLDVVSKRASDYGHRRTAWTLRLLIKTMAAQTGVTVSTTTMSRLLKELRVRPKSPKPLAPCPWTKRARKRRIKALRTLIEQLPENEVCVWEDETDIDLNPRLGKDWMPPGVRRTVMTPGKNVKHQIAAAMDATTGRLIWATGGKKNSGLFILLLRKLLDRYAGKKVIHVILDNYCIHSSRQTRAWLAEHGRRIRLHFLAPYSPDDNKIEVGVWRHMHAEVTYNHAETRIEDLVANVSRWLIRRDRAAWGVAKSRKAV
jgi:transposase